MEQLETILNNIRGGVIICDFDDMTKSSEVVYINKGWTDITGYTIEELNKEKNGNPQALVYAEDKPNVDAQYLEQIQHGGEYEMMYRIVHKNGTLRWVIDKGMVTFFAGGKLRNQSIMTEVTVIKEQEEHLRVLAQTDQLTDLYNKVTFALFAQTVLKRQKEKLHAMLLMDIDNFKGINDNYGHAFGDKVLIAVARKLKEQFRSRDVLGRVGGDEFMILMTNIPDFNTSFKKVEELRIAICGIQITEKMHTPITISIGISFFTNNQTYEQLFDAADEALYCAKNNGRNQFAVYPQTKHP